MAEIRRDHVGDALPFVTDRSSELGEVGAALSEGGRARTLERAALRLQDHAHFGVRHHRHGRVDELLLQRFLHRPSSYLIH
jgi:hypothetical protein